MILANDFSSGLIRFQKLLAQMANRVLLDLARAVVTSMKLMAKHSATVYEWNKISVLKTKEERWRSALYFWLRFPLQFSLWWLSLGWVEYRKIMANLWGHNPKFCAVILHVLCAGSVGRHQRGISGCDGDFAQPQVDEHSARETTAGWDCHRTGGAGKSFGGELCAHFWV